VRGRLLAVGVAVLIAVIFAIVMIATGTDKSTPTPKSGPGSLSALEQELAAQAPVDAGWSERGIDITSYQPDVFTGPTVGQQLDRIKATGSTTVAIVITWYQPDKTSNDVQPDGAKSATDDGVRAIASAAKSRGMTVVLKPHVDVVDGTFRGEIAPSDPAAWMRSYTGFATHVADLAGQVGASTFVVGTELASMSGRTDDWRNLIGQVRQKFGGRLTYGANWVDEAEKIQFWDALDFIGVDAYMPLVKNNPDPSVADLIRGWQPWQARLNLLAHRIGRPIVFTELGYPSRLGAAEQPAQEGSGAISQPAQARAYEAAFRAWKGVSWFRGIWWWDWPGDGGDPARDAGGYTPAGKLAERTLTRWLASAPSAQETPTPPQTTPAPIPPPTTQPPAPTTPTVTQIVTQTVTQTVTEPPPTG
jgi:hypothetical protein